jgi:beta-lactam-binding protein with PASTA domain
VRIGAEIESVAASTKAAKVVNSEREEDNFRSFSPQMSQRYVRTCKPKVTESKKKKSMDTATAVEKKSRQQLTTWPSLSRGVTVLPGAAQLSHQFLPLAAQHTGRQAEALPGA